MITICSYVMYWQRLQRCYNCIPLCFLINYYYFVIYASDFYVAVYLLMEKSMINVILKMNSHSLLLHKVKLCKNVFSARIIRWCCSKIIQNILLYCIHQVFIILFHHWKVQSGIGKTSTWNIQCDIYRRLVVKFREKKMPKMKFPLTLCTAIVWSEVDINSNTVCNSDAD